MGGPPGEGGEPGAVTGLSAQELSLGIVCQAPTGGRNASPAPLLHAGVGRDVWSEGDALRPDSANPQHTLRGAVGTRAKPTASIRGTRNATVSAQDAGGGVAETSGGRRAPRRDLQRAVQFHVSPKPCPTSTGAQTLALPTTELSDGHPRAHGRRHRCGGQSVDRRLRTDHGRQQSSASARRAHGDGDAGRRVHVYGDLGRPSG